MSWLSWWMDADWVVQGIFLILMALSLIGWTIIFHKWRKLNGLLTQERRFRYLLEVGEPVDGRPTLLIGLLILYTDKGRHGEVRMAHALREKRVELESGLTFLASIGVATPFIGLLGTVWGIMHALAGLNQQSALSLDLVAGPVAEALVATAAGLFAAIPAAMGYNLLIRRLRRVMTMAEGNALALMAKQQGEEDGRRSV